MARKLPRLATLALLVFVPYFVLQVRIFVLNTVPLQPTSHFLAVKPKAEIQRSALPKLELKGEIEKGLEYVNRFKDTKRKLVFVHIPKAAGTTVEEVGGLQARVAWGSCLFNHKPKRPGGVCQYPPGQFEWPSKIGYWHLPTQLFPLKGINPYENADLFAVVREPFDRLLSEYYYICRRKITKHWDFVDCNRTRVQEPEYMNEWIRHKLEQIPAGRLTPNDLLNYNGHYTPQSQFLMSYPSQIRMIDYVLNMQNLAPEFNALMKAYGISAEMLPHRKNAARNASTGDLEASHFDAKTLDLFHERYGDDMDITHDRKLNV